LSSINFPAQRAAVAAQRWPIRAATATAITGRIVLLSTGVGQGFFAPSIA
jgi:hypothetical protein